MKKRLIALVLASAMVIGTATILSGCNDTPAEPEHKTHYDVDADGKCDKCNADMEGHQHIFSVLWESDAENHWHKATCAHTDEKAGKEAHDFSAGICKVCGTLEAGLYCFEAEDALLNDNDAPNSNTMVIETGKHEFTESGKEDGAIVSNVGYFGGGAQGQTITWNFKAASAVTGVKLTLRLASSDGEWSDKLIRPIALDQEGAPTLTVNNAPVSLEGQTLAGLENLTQADMQNGVAYHNFCEIVITVDLVAGDNSIVLTSGSKGCNVDKIMIKTDVELTFEKTDNSSRPSNH